MSDGAASSPADHLPTDRLRRFSTALRELGSARDVDETLQLIVDLATELVPGADYADVMFVRSGRVTTPVSTDEITVKADRAQEDAGEGPCLDALYDEEFVVAHDLERDPRWPQFSARAVELGIRSTAAFRLFRDRDGHRRFGALNMFGTESEFDEPSVELGFVFAAHCSAVLAGAIEEEGLQSALDSRDLIGQAKGILMARHRLSPEQAYAMLQRASNDTNVKVRDLARIVADTGTLP